MTTLRTAVQYLAKLFRDEFWVFLLLSIGLAFVFPAFGRTWLKPLALPAILAQMYVVMLNIAPENLLASVRDWRPLFRSQLLLFLLSPLFAFLAHFIYEPVLVLGIAVMTSMPSGMSSPFFTLQFGGNAALAIVITTVGHLLVPILAPLWVKAIAGGTMDVDVSLIFWNLVKLVLVPFTLAWLTRRILGNAKTLAVYRRIGWTAGVFIMIVSWGIVADITAASIPIIPLAVGIALLNGLFFIIGYFAGGSSKRTLAMTTGYRNVTLGMVLSTSVWGNPVIALPSVVWTLTHNLYAVFLLFVHRRRLRQSKENTA